jgi:hypothetical protein
MGTAVSRARTLKTKINKGIQAMELEGTLGIYRGGQPHVNISNSTIANLNLGNVIGDLNGSIQTLTTAGQSELADAVRQLSEAITTSGELANRKELLENLTHVSEQAALPAEKRKLGPLKATVGCLKTGLAVGSQLLPLWLKVEEALRGMGIGR